MTLSGAGAGKLETGFSLLIDLITIARVKHTVTLYGLLSALMLALIMIFLVTSADSTIYVLGIMTSDGSENPSNAVKGIWAVLIAVITGVLIVSSGLQGLQSIALIAALPFTVIMLLISVSLLKSLSQEEFEAATPESDRELKAGLLTIKKLSAEEELLKKKPDKNGSVKI